MNAYGAIGRVGVLAALLLGSVACRAVGLDWIYARIEPGAMARLQEPGGLPDLHASTCETCHPEQTAEWRQSKMGEAMVDPFFVADFEAQGAPFVCLRCHAPLEEQQPILVTGLHSLRPLVGEGESNPAFDEDLQSEGVTCVVCHLRDGAMVGPIEDPRGAPHETRYDADFGAPETCERCHQLDPPPFSGLKRPLPDTHGEHARWKEVTGGTASCSDCHMPRVQRAAAVGGAQRSVARHTFVGAWDAALVRGGLRVSDARVSPDGVEVTLENRAGHAFPTAEPSRALVVVVVDPEGQEIGKVELARRVPLPRLRDEGDTSLQPGEVRRVQIPVTGEPAELRVRFLQMRFLPDEVSPDLVAQMQRPIEIARLPL